MLSVICLETRVVLDMRLSSEFVVSDSSGRILSIGLHLIMTEGACTESVSAYRMFD